jgi:hypothetical protein
LASKDRSTWRRTGNEQAGGCPKAAAANAHIGGACRAADVVATATEVAARFHRRSSMVRVVGLSRIPLLGRTLWSGVTMSTALVTCASTRGHATSSCCLLEPMFHRVNLAVDAKVRKTRSRRRYPGFERSPLRRSMRLASTPSRLPPKRLPAFGTVLPSSALVPSLSFLPTSTVFSASTLCGSVAPRCRPWGSPRFELRSLCCRSSTSSSALPGGAIPFGAFPPTTAVPCHHGPLPSRRSNGLGQPARRASTSLQTPGPTSRPQGFPPQPDPLHAARRCRRVAARCSLGLLSRRGSRLTRASLRRTSRWKRWGQVPSRAYTRGAGAVGRVPTVLPSPSRCVGLSLAPHLDDRATLRCDVPRRVASRATIADAPRHIRSRRPFRHAFRRPCREL